MRAVRVRVLVLHHQRGFAEKLEVFGQEGAERGAPFLEAQDEELDEPEDGPGAVSEVAVSGVLVHIGDVIGARRVEVVCVLR